MMQRPHTAEAPPTGGREGRVRSSDGALSLELAVPKELGGPGGLLSNPEQLFAAGFAPCFENAVRVFGRRRRVRIGQASVTARVGIGPDWDGGFGLSVGLHGRRPGLDPGEA